MRPAYSVLLGNRVSAIGVALTTASALIFFFLLALELAGALQNPYMGIVQFVILPALFLLGLLLIPLGRWQQRRRDPAAAAEATWPKLDLADPNIRRALLFFAVATLANILILSTATFGAVHYSESQAFCGQTCHEPMTPEFTAHGAGLHANVGCVSCHVGPGVGGYVRGKLAGVRQLYLFTRGTFHRPIPTPVHNLPAVSGTCMQCHWSDRHVGDRVKLLVEHADDEANTASTTTLRLHVGGARGGATGAGGGIHWHANPDNVVEYVATDDTREEITYVRSSGADGKVAEYFAEGVTAADLAGKPRRRMDCTDCHNRPAHTFSSTPDRAVDAAINDGLIDATLPFVRREAVRALAADYPSRDAALAGIEQSMRTAMKDVTNGPALGRAIDVTRSIYSRSVFPSMKITWGTYPIQLGHTISNGCFRCHDESHKTSAGQAISQDCSMCHTME